MCVCVCVCVVVFACVFVFAWGSIWPWGSLGKQSAWERKQLVHCCCLSQLASSYTAEPPDPHTHTQTDTHTYTPHTHTHRQQKERSLCCVGGGFLAVVHLSGVTGALGSFENQREPSVFFCHSVSRFSVCFTFFNEEEDLGSGHHLKTMVCSN